MSVFAVTRETIAAVEPIAGADRIELARLAGMDFQFVVGKGEYRPGDNCIYFPLDSLLPQAVAQQLGVAGKLAGKEKNRIKTVRLRGQISQGIVGQPDLAPSDVSDLTTYFGVIKYEPPEQLLASGCVGRPLPAEVVYYDIESADRYPEIVRFMMDKEVVVTEKLEGSNWSLLCRTDFSISVCTHAREVIETTGTHTWWEVARKLELIAAVKDLVRSFGKPVVLYGEMLGPGIQKNIYGLKQHDVRFFDMRLGGAWLDWHSVMATLHSVGLASRLVPWLSCYKTLGEWLAGRTVKQASVGKSLLSDHTREGIVIHPTEEAIFECKRAVVKQHNPEYLLGAE